MRNLQVIIITLFLLVSVVFTTFFCYDRLIMDHTAPMIVCDGLPLFVSVDASDQELCAGLVATDDVDGDITDRIVVRKMTQLSGENSANVSYSVFDSSSNVCTYTRTVFYTDFHKPRFDLTQPLVYNVGSTVILADRLFAEDNLDGDISARIRVDASYLTNSAAGEYPLPVRVTNSSGDTTDLTFTVLMQNLTSRHPVITLEDYLIYLPQGEDLSEEQLRDFIKTVRVSKTGKTADADEVEITSEIDASRRGTYDVSYSYTNASGLTYTVILTVVVE